MIIKELIKQCERVRWGKSLSYQKTKVLLSFDDLLARQS